MWLTSTAAGANPCQRPCIQSRRKVAERCEHLAHSRHLPRVQIAHNNNYRGVEVHSRAQESLYSAFSHPVAARRAPVMYSRDPFNLRKAPPSALHFLQKTAAQTVSTTAAAVQKTKETLADADMSFRLPNNVPNFDNAQRRFEDNVWNKFTGKEDGLPMYKDKPAGYGAKRQAGRWLGGKRRVGLVALLVFGLLYWTGWLGGGGQEGVESGRNEWNIIPGALTGKKGKVDWERRRESVRDAFLLSWKGYEEHGWGMLHALCFAHRRVRRC